MEMSFKMRSFTSMKPCLLAAKTTLSNQPRNVCAARYVQTWADQIKEQALLERQLLNPVRSETCQSGTDDEVARHKSPYDPSPTNTRVEEEVLALREEYKLEGDIHDPLLVSPANEECSLILDPMLGGAVHNAQTLRSVKGWSNKHKQVLLRREPYQIRKYEDVFLALDKYEKVISSDTFLKHMAHRF